MVSIFKTSLFVDIALEFLCLVVYWQTEELSFFALLESPIIICYFRKKICHKIIEVIWKDTCSITCKYLTVEFNSKHIYYCVLWLDIFSSAQLPKYPAWFIEARINLDLLQSSGHVQCNALPHSPYIPCASCQTLPNIPILRSSSMAVPR